MMKILRLAILLGGLAMTACSTSPSGSSVVPQGPGWKVSAGSAGPIRLGMSVAQVREVLDPGYRVVDPPNLQLRGQSPSGGPSESEIGGPALHVLNDLYSVHDPSGRKILEFLTSNPANPEYPGNRIVMISATSPWFSTAEGVRPGNRIAEVAHIYGPASLLDSDNEGFGREWVVFRNGPSGIRFQASQANLGPLAGIYGASSLTTSSFAPNAEIRALVIGRR
ncbi:MAG: hypothetical protein WEB60_06055 [Terrimicrobiaceae bacterium]